MNQQDIEELSRRIDDLEHKLNQVEEDALTWWKLAVGIIGGLIGIWIVRKLWP